MRKFRFGKNVITWIETLLKDHLLCIINGKTSTQYCNLERGAHKGDPIFAYLFILTLEALFVLIKKHPEIKDIEIFEHCFLDNDPADDTTIFSERFTIHCTIQYFFLFYRIETKSIKMWNSGNRSLEKSLIGSLQ